MSSAAANRELVLRFFTEIWNARKVSLLENLLEFPYEIENLLSRDPADYINREEMEAHLGEWFAGFPDLQVVVDLLIAEGDKVFAQTRYQGIQLGAYRGIEATKNRIDISVLAIFRVKSGKLSGHSVLVDAMGLYRQLGLTHLFE